MKRCFLFPLLALLLFTPVPGHADTTLTLVADQWCPYNCTPGDDRPGYIVELMQHIFAKHNITVKYESMAWTSAIAKTREGEFDALIGASQSDAPDFVFPHAIAGMSMMEFWVRKNYPWKYKGVSSLDNVRIGIIEGYSYSKMMDLYLNLHRGEKKRIQAATGDNALETNLNKLEAGTIDVTVEDRNVVRHYYESQSSPVAIQPAGSPLDHDKPEDSFIYVAFAPNKPDSERYAQLFTEGIEQMRKNGELKILLERYNVEDWFPVTQR